MTSIHHSSTCKVTSTSTLPHGNASKLERLSRAQALTLNSGARGQAKMGHVWIYGRSLSVCRRFRQTLLSLLRFRRQNYLHFLLLHNTITSQQSHTSFVFHSGNVYTTSTTCQHADKMELGREQLHADAYASDS